MGWLEVHLPGAENDGAVLDSALRYAVREHVRLRVFLPQMRARDEFQDQLHRALLDVVSSLGRRPESIEVVAGRA